MRPGDRLGSLEVLADAGVPVRYAEASGDLNAVHTDHDFAVAQGLPGIVLHGLYTMAQVARASVAAAGGDPRRLRRLSTDFRSFAVPGEPLLVDGTVSGDADDAGDDAVVVEWSVSQGGRRVLRRTRAELTPPR